MANPFSYQLKQISSTDENKNPVTCSCQCSFLPKGKSFYVTKNTTTIVDSFSNFKSPELNLTKITI